MSANNSQNQLSQSTTPSQEHLLPSTLRNINRTPSQNTNQRSLSSLLPGLVYRPTPTTTASHEAAITATSSRVVGFRARSTWQLSSSTGLNKQAGKISSFQRRGSPLESGLRNRLQDGSNVSLRNQSEPTSPPLNSPVSSSPTSCFSRIPRLSPALSLHSYNNRSQVVVQHTESCDDSQKKCVEAPMELSLDKNEGNHIISNASDALLELHQLSLTDEESANCILVSPPDMGNTDNGFLSLLSPLASKSPNNGCVDLHDNVEIPVEPEEDIFEHPPRRSSRLIAPSKVMNNFVFCRQVKPGKRLTKRENKEQQQNIDNQQNLEPPVAENVGPPLPKKFQKGCFVPGCQSNNRDDPFLLFASLTKVAEHRLNVFEKIRQQNDPTFENKSLMSGLFICELHFSAESDTQILFNYLQGTKRKVIKPGAIPTKFCHTSQNEWNSDLLPASLEKNNVEPGKLYIDVLKDPRLQKSKDASTFSLDAHLFPDNDEVVQARADHFKHLEEETMVQFAAEAAEQRVEAANLNSQVLISVSQASQNSMQLGSLLENLTQKSSGSDPEYIPPDTQDSMDSFARGLTADKKVELREGTMKLMKKNPQLFMGVQTDFICIIDSLAEEFKGEKDAQFKVMITLRKLRLNEVYELIGLYCGTSANNVSQIFRSTLPTIAACLKELIFNIPKGTTLRNLPIPFRLNFFKTSHTLDCFEVQIQMPSNAKHRAICYSAYKGGTTLKYLVSVTPDGYCNYLARAYGGRNSDIGIFKDCGLLDVLESGSAVLADRGFKGLEAVLDSVGVKLLRPPSVSGGRALSKEDCMTGRQIASVRIHVERYIGRLRGFQMIAPHATIAVKMIPYVDAAAVVACGLTNLGAPLIRGNECGL